MRVVLVDDDAEFLQWARAKLDESPRFSVVGESTSPEQAVPLVSGMKADLLVVDFEMPGTSGFEIARRIRDEAPAVKVIVMSLHTSRYFEVLAHVVGARGFLPKERFGVEAIEAMLNGT